MPLSQGAIRPTQGKTLAVMEVSGGSQSFNAVNNLRVLGRWMRMLVIPNQVNFYFDHHLFLWMIFIGLMHSSHPPSPNHLSPPRPPSPWPINTLLPPLRKKEKNAPQKSSKREVIEIESWMLLKSCLNIRF